MDQRIDVWLYTTEQVAKAAGVPAETLASWLRRHDVFVGADHPAVLQHPGAGRTRYFSDRQVRHLALVAELACAGVNLPAACRLAAVFSHHNGADNAAASLLGEQQAESHRPGCLYPEGDTVFRVFMHSDRDWTARVERASDVAKAPFMDGHRACRTVLVVDLQDLVARVNALLRGAR